MFLSLVVPPHLCSGWNLSHLCQPQEHLLMFSAWCRSTIRDCLTWHGQCIMNQMREEAWQSSQLLNCPNETLKSVPDHPYYTNSHQTFLSLFLQSFYGIDSLAVLNLPLDNADSCNFNKFLRVFFNMLRSHYYNLSPPASNWRLLLVQASG